MRFFHKTTEAEVKQIREWNLIGLSSVEIGLLVKKHNTTVLYWLGRLKNKKPKDELLKYSTMRK